MFLTKEELEILTNRKYRAHQIKWLILNRIKFFIPAGAAHPRVLKDEVIHLLSSNGNAIKHNKTNNTSNIQPNLAALKSIGRIQHVR